VSHGEQQAFFAEAARGFPDHFTGVRVLEVGSLDVNGSIRRHFTDCDYTGVDVAGGPGVDLVAQGQDLDFPDGSFDTTVSAECFEHNPYWSETFANMVRMTRPGGLVAFSCASTGRPEHGTARADAGSSPLTVALGWEYYRNLTEEDFRDVFDFDGLFSDHGFSYHAGSHDLYFRGVRR
jgi:SAM-dependent methyltransferase